MLLLLANIILPLSAVTGMYCIAHKLKVGFLVFLLAEISMFYVGMETRNYGFMATSCIYFCMNIYSYYCWRR